MTSKQLDFTPYIVILYKRKFQLLIHFILIAGLATYYAFAIAKKYYRSDVVVLPPVSNENTLGISSILGFSAPSLFNSNLQPEQIETIFWSKHLRSEVVRRFGLIKNYKLDKGPNQLERALRVMGKMLYLETNEKGGFAYSKILSYTIVSYHTAPDTAKLIADYAFTLIDSTVKAISVGRAQRNRVFVERQLNANKIKLDSLQKAFGEFQKENKAYDIPEQLKLSLSAYANLKSEEVLNDLRIRALEEEFNKDSPELLDLKSNTRVIRAKLKKIESDYDAQVLPSLDMSTRLLPGYINGIRDLEVQNQLILLLSKEYEQAKLQESKDISPLIILDQPMVPEYKAKPKRLFLMAMIIGSYMTALLFFILAQEFFRIHVKDSTALKNLITQLR